MLAEIWYPEVSLIDDNHLRYTCCKGYIEGENHKESLINVLDEYGNPISEQYVEHIFLDREKCQTYCLKHDGEAIAHRVDLFADDAPLTKEETKLFESIKEEFLENYRRH